MTATVDFTAIVSNVFLPDKALYLQWLMGLSGECVGFNVGLILINVVEQCLTEHKKSISITSIADESTTNHGTTIATTVNIHSNNLRQTISASELSRYPIQVVPRTMLRKYVLTQYRNFEMIEHFLHRPRFLAVQFQFPLPERIRNQLIELFAI